MSKPGTTMSLPLSEMIAASPVAAVISNPRLPDNPIVDCNQAFLMLTGYGRKEIIGQNCRFLSGPKTEPELTQTLRTGIAELRPTMVEITNYKKDGTLFRNAVMVAPIFDANERLEYFLGSQVEVSAPRTVMREERVKAAGARIEKLTTRQRQILAEMLAGRPNKVIAAALNISPRTVKMHVAAVLRSLNVRTRADAIRLAVEAGF